MRFFFSLIALLLALGVVTLSAPRFFAAVAYWPGFEATELALGGEDIRPESYERARRSLLNAGAFLSDRVISTKLAVIEHNRGRQSTDLDIRDAHFASSREAVFESLSLAPVQPLAWLLLTQIAYEQQDYATAAEAFDLALHTSHYMKHQSRERAVLALALWDLTAEETRVKSMDAIVDVMAREIDLVASYAAAIGVEDDVRQRLRSFEPDGVVLWSKLGAAVRRYRNDQQLRVAAYEEYSAMRRTLIATSMLITTTLPLMAEAMSVHEYITIRRGEHPIREPDSVNEYLGAVLDGLMVLGYFNREEGIALFCVPDRNVIDINVPEFRVNLDALLEQYERDMPNFNNLARTRSVGLISLELLIVMYPCDQ